MKIIMITIIMKTATTSTIPIFTARKATENRNQRRGRVPEEMESVKQNCGVG